jgi:hypothetical protein
VKTQKADHIKAPNDIAAQAKAAQAGSRVRPIIINISASAGYFASLPVG